MRQSITGLDMKSIGYLFDTILLCLGQCPTISPLGQELVALAILRKVSANPLLDTASTQRLDLRLAQAAVLIVEFDR